MRVSVVDTEYSPNPSMLEPEIISKIGNKEDTFGNIIVDDPLKYTDQKSRLVREELERIREERKQAQMAHEEELESANDRLSFLHALHENRKRQQNQMILYRTALTTAYENNEVPPRYVFDQQVKLLECFHQTEVFRNQWEIVSNHLIRITQNMLYEASFFKELNRRLKQELTLLLGPFSEQEDFLKILRGVANFFKNLINSLKCWMNTKTARKKENLTFSSCSMIM